MQSKKKGIKPLMPSLREKKRYLAYEIICNANIQHSLIGESIIKAYKKLFGEIGFAESGILLVNHENNKGVIKVSHKTVNNLKAALAIIKDINGKDVIVRSLGVSGMLNKANNYVKTRC